MAPVEWSGRVLSMPTPIIIRAMPERHEFATYLCDRLPDAAVLWDDLPRTLPSPVRAMRQFLRSMEFEGPTLHLEDDVLLAEDFRAKAEAVIAQRPDVIVQFFSMRKADLTTGSRWDRNLCMNQCLYFPAGYGPQIREYWQTWPRRETDPSGYDLLIRDWLRSRRERYWIHCPSLVQHRVARSQIDPRRSSKRQSATFRG